MIITDPERQRYQAQRLIWWILWASILGGLVLIYFLYGRGHAVPKELPPEKMLTGLVGVVPLFVSVVIRWLVLPRYTEMNRALIMFIIGLSLAEACGILGIFLGGPYRDDLFVLGVFGIVQYVPVFTSRYLEPKGSGFIPNN